jgi:hypothetical protein
VVFLSWVWTMATTSLWNDEIYTIFYFSGKGFRTVVTDYRAPNNHVFFNLVNALLPGRMSMDPLRARSLAILATAAALWLALRFFWTRGLMVTGAVVVFLLASNGTLLELVLQARGYGFLLLFAAAASALLPRSLDRADRRGLWATVAVVVVGAYTVPTFAFFGALWLLALFAVRRDLATAAAGIAAGVMIVLLYLPFSSQLVTQLRTYGNEWGREYGKWSAVGDTVRQFAFPSVHGEPILSARIALFIPFALGPLAFLPIGALSPAERMQCRFLAVTGALFFIVCRLLETPLVRTTCFIAVPLLLAAGLLAGGAAETFAPVRARSWAAIAVAVGLTASFARPMTPARFLPIEDWRGVSRFLETTFPPELPVYASWAGDFLEAHGSSGRRTTVPFDDASFARGELVLFDDALAHGNRLAATKSLATSAFVRFPQRRSDDGFTEVRFAPPPERHVESLATESGRRAGPEPFDGDFRSGWSTESERVASGGWVTFTLTPGRPYRSLVVVLEGAAGAPFRGWITFDGGWSCLPAGSIDVRGSVLLAHLGDRPVRTVHLDLGVPRDGERIVEAWAYLSGGAEERRQSMIDYSHGH